MRIPLFIFLSVLLTVPFYSIANERSPYSVLEIIGSDLFSRIADNQKEIEAFPRVMRVIVKEELMPFIDYRYSAFKILGSHLKKASKEQRMMFSEAMSQNLERTYASALMNYQNQQVLFETEKSVVGHQIVAIKAQIIDTNKPTINVVFKMRVNKKTREWKVFDMVIEGISLLSSKKSELGKRISQYGVEQVTLELMSLEG
jgi:phospholipid transport system substrate-binding protein